MAISKTSLINKALVLCGASTITDITADTNNARICNDVYEIALKSVLTECCWTFAATRSTLSVTSATTMPWYYNSESYVYTKPTLCLKIFETKDPELVWREEGDYFISETSSPGIKYIYYHDEPSKYPAYFVEALIDKLCSDISYVIINSASKAEAFLAKYTKVSLPKAMSSNSQIGTQQQPRDNEWELAKDGNGGNAARSYS